MSIPIGIIGAGRVAEEHIKAVHAIGGTIAALFDADPERASALAASHGDLAPGATQPHVASSLDEFLAMDFPAVVVAVPNVSHAEVAIAALQAGKDVLLEKPMAMTVEQCDGIIDAMQRSGRLVQMGFVCRTSAKAIAAREMVMRGELGEVYHVKAASYRQRGIPGLGGWFTNRACSGGGVLVDIGVHLIDLVMHLTGARRAETVSGVCERRFGWPIDRYVFQEMWAGPPRLDGVCDVEDSAMGLVRFNDGPTLELNLAWASNMPRSLHPDGILLLGDRGGLFFDLWGKRCTLTCEVDGAVVDREIASQTEDLWNRAWAAQHQHFARVVADRVEPMATAQDGRAVQEVLAAWQMSSDARREVAIGDLSPV